MYILISLKIVCVYIFFIVIIISKINHNIFFLDAELISDGRGNYQSIKDINIYINSEL